MMNFEQLKEHFQNEQLPIELAFGYTLDRNDIHINLYENMVSRIVTDGSGNVLQRNDQSEAIDFFVFTMEQKRFYPNRVNDIFKQIMEDNEVALCITNSDSNSKPIFDFDEPIDFTVPVEQIPRKFYKLNENSYAYKNYMDGTGGGYKYALFYERIFQTVYVIMDARAKISDGTIDTIFVPVNEKEYLSNKKKWDEQNQCGPYKITEIWATISTEHNICIATGTYKEIEKVTDKQNQFRYNSHFSKRGYRIVEEDNLPPKFDEGFYHTYEEAFNVMQSLKM